MTLGLADGAAIMAAGHSFAAMVEARGMLRRDVPLTVTAAVVASLAAKLKGRDIEKRQILSLWTTFAGEANVEPPALVCAPARYRGGAQ